jgi:hypothetical protein
MMLAFEDEEDEDDDCAPPTAISSSAPPPCPLPPPTPRIVIAIDDGVVPPPATVVVPDADVSPNLAHRRRTDVTAPTTIPVHPNALHPPRTAAAVIWHIPSTCTDESGLLNMILFRNKVARDVLYHAVIQNMVLRKRARDRPSSRLSFASLFVRSKVAAAEDDDEEREAREENRSRCCLMFVTLDFFA